MNLTNSGNAVIQNLRITAVTAISNGFTLNMQLPRNFAGPFNPGGSTAFNMFFQAAAGTNPDAAFSARRRWRTIWLRSQGLLRWLRRRRLCWLRHR